MDKKDEALAAEKPPVASQKPVDFEKVEALRKHMLLSINSMADIFGVSRVTYHSWRTTGSIRAKNDARVRSMIRTLVNLVIENKWPNPDVFGASQADRLQMLKDLLKEIVPQA